MTFNFQDNINKDAESKTLNQWLELTDGWDMSHPLPKLHEHEGITVVRDDLIEGGTKARALDFLLSKVDSEWITYVCPRQGAAPFAIAKYAKAAGRKVRMYIPSSKRMSELQAFMFDMGCDEVIFERIASQKNLNRTAQKWAEETGAYFVPMGLNVELATAALIRVAHELPYTPKTMAVATSTGVLGRALRVAWPSCEFTSVAVARNLKEGEMGPGNFHPYHKAFSQEADVQPPFPSYPTYDSKAWEVAVQNGIESMWNVAVEPRLTNTHWYDTIDSECEWYQRKTYTKQLDGSYSKQEETWEKK